MANKKIVKDKEREFLLECIELYRDLPALWQIKNKIYHDRDKKNMAYDLLLAKYNEMFPQATKEDLKKKINSLRTNYRKELKKHVYSMKSRASTDSVYVPTSWYFKKMNFLRDQELPLDSESAMDTHRIATADRNEDNEEQRSETRSSTDEIQDSQSSQTPSNTTNTHASKKARKNEQVLNLAYERLSEVNDEYHWGMAFAADLRKMEKTQQLYAKKAIAEIIMEGQLGLLHRHSVTINANPPSNSAAQIGAWPWPQYSNQSSSPSHNHVPPSPSYSNPSPSSYSIPSPSSVYVNQSGMKIIAKPEEPLPDIPLPSYVGYNTISEPAPAQIVNENPVGKHTKPTNYNRTPST